jgi:hypothetical protein
LAQLLKHIAWLLEILFGEPWHPERTFVPHWLPLYHYGGSNSLRELGFMTGSSQSIPYSVPD